MSTWLIILIIVLCLAVLLYFCRPLLKKIKIPKIQLKKKEKVKKQKNIIPIEKQEEKVDTDIKVEENNLDYDGFFKTDFSSQDNNYDLQDTVSQNYDDLFDDLFLDSKPKKNNLYNSLKDEELSDYFSEDYVSNEDKDIAKIIQDLPIEIKAMIFANLLDKKEDDK